MQTSLLEHKPFLDYSGQIDYLKSRHLKIPDEKAAIDILKKASYYGLINGYKDSFKDHNTHNFKDGTTFDAIYKLYLMDAELREIFLKHILILEKNIKSSISYHFSELYGNGMKYYLDKNNYEYGNHIHDLDKLFRKLRQKIYGNYISPQVLHYITIYKDVPLWVLVTDLTLGETAAMYKYLKGHCKTIICNDFHAIEHAHLGKMLIVITKYRNICAHGNRLFNYHTQDSILDNSIHQKLLIERKGSTYQYGKSDLFSIVISLKYLLSNDDFTSFFHTLKKLLAKYKPGSAIMTSMGFPSNWMTVLDIRAY